ncbi:hypothetical protein KP509_16G072500 [Ceratopteris richardii]|uniref:GDSL esterase/lipase n=1 Tax=Ceratopteris richardii TaxID=49495 RepID=A0A8T2T426_CERRI|nr:hypothetical protein KP509_16G072500 [Ceratopteris richardii]
MAKYSGQLTSSAMAFIVMSTLMTAMLTPSCAKSVAMFVFGDSLVDTGNNNFIPSLARANFPPNGLDYPTRKATGRFCNGKIISDLISDYMGTPSIKSYLDPSNDESSLLLGANFASAGAGILNTTGRLFLTVLTVEQQFGLFAEYKQRVAGFIGQAAMENLVSTALFSLTFGGNDYINNYLMGPARSNKLYTLPQWQDILISTYKGQLKQLYGLGARKFSISDLGPLGCIPSQLNINKSPDGSCVPKLQNIAINFNKALKAITEELNAELPDATYVYVNGFQMSMDYITNPTAYGLQVSNSACCGQGKYNGFLICNRLSKVCADRTKYVFWDPYHPTETVNRMVTQRVLNGPPSDLSPVNIRQLVGI